MKIKYSIRLTLGLTVMIGCHSEHDEEHHEIDSFQVTSPVRMDTTILKEYVCQIHAINHIESRAQEHGFLDKMYVDEGQYVRKGEKLFQIMPALYQAEVEKAKAEAEYARIEYENTRMLADKNVVSPNQLALAEANYSKAKAELSLAQIHLDFTNITAPYDGILDKFHVRLGSLLEEGELLTTLSDNSQMWVYFNVSEAEYLNLRSHHETDSMVDVQLLMANGELFPYVGKVETIEADFNS